MFLSNKHLKAASSESTDYLLEPANAYLMANSRISTWNLSLQLVSASFALSDSFSSCFEFKEQQMW